MDFAADPFERIAVCFSDLPTATVDGLRRKGQVEAMRLCCLCLDCGADTVEIDEYYMLHDAIWLVANPDTDGMLCIGCVEGRLGRRLGPSDFVNAGVNFSRPSARLRARILGVEETPAA
jgi:hypothetical protein